jgi:hypothetical protein
MDIIVNDTKDISKDLPGPDVSIAINIHEDIKDNNKESEMIETAINIEESA